MTERTLFKVKTATFNFLSVSLEALLTQFPLRSERLRPPQKSVCGNPNSKMTALEDRDFAVVIRL